MEQEMSSLGVNYLSPEEYFRPNRRFSGILLHPTSLPGKFGIGDLGPSAYRFIDFLHENGQQLWQVLPLGPTGYGNSPYQSFSAFAGNQHLISPEKLQDLGLLREEVEPPAGLSETRIDYQKVSAFKEGLLEKAFENFCKDSPSALQKQFDLFCQLQHWWLEDYALFISLKKAHDLKAWIEWDDRYCSRYPAAISAWKAENTREIEYQKFIQFLFFIQWNGLRNHAHAKNVMIIGDIPIFAAYDSADVWANPDLFYLNGKGKPIYVAGVPPDYFSETGQRWGNPLYRWDKMKDRGYHWWLQQLQHCFSRVDILRIDHFRGFEAYWRIPADEPTAKVGEWISGPGADFFMHIKIALGTLPIIAEDLGIITPEVKDLLQQTGLPGMRVLQFAFGGDAGNPYLPHNYDYNTIVYTGTHDNDTTAGWIDTAPKNIRNHVLDYLNSNGKDVVGDLIRAAWRSVAKMAVIPIQDLLRLGTEGRMNYPGTNKGNWEWRFTWEQLTKERGKELASLSKLYGR